MADMKKVYEDLIILNLYKLISGGRISKIDPGSVLTWHYFP